VSKSPALGLMTKRTLLWLCLLFLFYSDSFAEEKSEGPPSRWSPQLISAQVSICPSSTTTDLRFKVLFEFAVSDGDLEGGVVYFSDGRTQQKATLSSCFSGVKKGVCLVRLSGKGTGEHGSTQLTLWIQDRKGNRSRTLNVPLSKPFELKQVLVSAMDKT
jgi:hypothetical protein